MLEKLIKSKKRVQQYGEVFTPSWMVQMMLDTEEIKESCQDIYATFLEPAAGDGNFLTAILERKLQAVLNQFDKKYWKTKSLFALASIYGIEFLSDNLELARSRMFMLYLDWYQKNLGEQLTSHHKIYKSAYFIIYKNIVQGNTLTKCHPENNDLIYFYEWRRVKGSASKIEVEKFSFISLLDEQVIESETQQLNLFELKTEEQETVSNRKIIEIQKIYQLEES
ncbi:MAG: methylase [Lactovum sp.]